MALWLHLVQTRSYTFIITGKENIIAVRLDTKSWDIRWYPGAGLYRNLWLVKTSPVHIAYNDVFCTTPEVNKERGILSVQTEVENHINQPIPVSVKVSVYKLNEKFNISGAPVAESNLATANIQGMKDHLFRFDIPVADPVLRDIYQRELYRAVVDLPFVSFRGYFAWFVWMFFHLMLILSVKNKLMIFINWAWYYLTKDSSLRLIIDPADRTAMQKK